jgi:hypothetical protein
MSFDRDLIFAYCQPINNLFCGAVYCVVGQVRPGPQSSYDWYYENRETIEVEAIPFIDTLDNEGNIDVYLKILRPDTLNQAGIKTYDFIVKSLRYLVWRYIYTRKIKNPKVHFCGEDGIYIGDEELEIVKGDYTEANVIRALSYINRYRLIDTYYKHVYKECDLENNLGLITLDTFSKILSLDYKEDFFLNLSILKGISSLAWEILHYTPTLSKKKKEREAIIKEVERFLFNRSILDIPPWWTFVEQDGYLESLASKNFKVARRRILWGKQEPDFKEWLQQINNSLPMEYALDIHRATKWSRPFKSSNFSSKSHK